MTENPYLIVVLKWQDLADLMQMARKSPDYREGYAWTAHAMHEANKAANRTLISNGMAEAKEF